MEPADKLGRIGAGSIGGKARGLGYLNLLVRDSKFRQFRNTEILVPPATVVTTSVFDRFVEDNDLGRCIGFEHDDEVLQTFSDATLPERAVDSLRAFLDEHRHPLAVRSSSVYEDASEHPFAGLYKTLLIPNNDKEDDERLKQLLSAIQLVFGSTYCGAPKAYMKRHGLPVDQESMAVILQELAGRAHSDLFYPRLSGVAGSINYFPVGSLTSEDGLCRLVVGLGLRAVEGGDAMCFSPRNPHVKPDFWSPQTIFRYAQREFDALDMTAGRLPIGLDDRATLRAVPLARAHDDGVLQDLVSWWNRADNTLMEGGLNKGEPLLTFNRLLAARFFPFAEALGYILQRAEAGFHGPVELEFAADFEHTGPDVSAEINLLQVRRSGDVNRDDTVEVAAIGDDTAVLLTSNAALGHGVDEDFQYIVYIPPGPRPPRAFSALAHEVEEINRGLDKRSARYLLIGPGRWGSKNPALGVPITFSQVSQAGAIVEVSSPDFHVDPSQGTHFFHNLTSGRVVYMAVDIGASDTLNQAWLDAQPDARGDVEGDLKLIEVAGRLVVRVDGKRHRALIHLT
jgi:hypothetical protein